MLKASSKLQIVKRKQETGNREHSSRASILFTVYCLPITKKAFTLAEVLITLGIIGTVAALTIPTLINNKAKQETVAKLEKAYTTLAQAVKLSEQDNGPNSNWDWGSTSTTTSENFETYWVNYLKIIKYCSSATDCGYGSINRFTTLSGGNGWGIVGSPTVTVLLSDGSLLEEIVSAKLIIIDINAGKGPNTYGKDVFLFCLDSNKGFMPYGYSTNNDCSQGNNGWYCAAKIMRDGWQIKDDYPW